MDEYTHDSTLIVENIGIFMLNEDRAVTDFWPFRKFDAALLKRYKVTRVVFDFSFFDVFIPFMPELADILKDGDTVVVPTEMYEQYINDDGWAAVKQYIVPFDKATPEIVFQRSRNESLS